MVSKFSWHHLLNSSFFSPIDFPFSCFYPFKKFSYIQDYLMYMHLFLDFLLWSFFFISLCWCQTHTNFYTKMGKSRFTVFHVKKHAAYDYYNSCPGWCGSVSAHLRTKGSPVRFPVTAHAWVLGQVPSKGCLRGNHTLMFLSLSFSLLSPISKNK